MAILLPTISTAFIAISGILVAIGWYAIAKRNIEGHMKLMKWAAICATIFFITYLSRTIVVGNTLFAGPDSVRVIYQVFLIFHIILATVGGVMGLVTLNYAYKRRYDKHRKIGPWTSVIWLATSITGVTVYALLYLIYPGGETSGVFDVIFGW
jgi:putative membrane protein